MESARPYLVGLLALKNHWRTSSILSVLLSLILMQLMLHQSVFSSRSTVSSRSYTPAWRRYWS
uniref:Uncharacterized protein n=1 Tax=Amphimedon queenslandica TaxID=400682 RepID=A0A1X7SX54_AMPQE